NPAIGSPSAPPGPGVMCACAACAWAPDLQSALFVTRVSLYSGCTPCLLRQAYGVVKSRCCRLHDHCLALSGHGRGWVVEHGVWLTLPTAEAGGFSVRRGCLPLQQQM